MVVFNVETGSPIEVRMSFFYFKSIGVCFPEKEKKIGEEKGDDSRVEGFSFDSVQSELFCWPELHSTFHFSPSLCVASF